MTLRTGIVLVLSASSLLACAGLAVPRTAFAQPAAAVLTGAIDAVTVYRGQALVTRTIDVPGAAGLRELVVTGLPEAIIPSSLYAESADGVEVRSVSYRIRPVGEDARDSVRAAEKAVRDARDALEGAKSRQSFLDWQRTYLDKLEGFVAPTAQTDLKNGVLNADTLTKLTELVTTRRKTQSDEGQKLSLETRTLNETLQLKERELSVLTASTSRTAREAVVFVNATKAGARLRLSYLVSGANWSPSYNLRIAGAAQGGAAGAPGAGAAAAAGAGRGAVLEYQASVQQMSGEDWGGVQLTLSTATPALVATGPSLQPLAIALASPQQAQAGALALLKGRSYEDAKKVLADLQRDAEQSRNLKNTPEQTWAQSAAQPSATPPPGEDRVGGAVVLSLDSGLNAIADQSQLLDLVSSTKVERKSSHASPLTVRQGDEGVSVSYKVAGRTSMPSRADQQLIQIATLDLPAKLTKAATPTLTQYIYNEAQLTNSSDMVLLAGPASSYVAGEFVGSAAVPTVAAGETFRAGFGIDTSLRSAKELIERTESTQGGNRTVEFTYKLTIENFGKAAASVRILDRLPSPKGTEITVKLLSQSPELSDDKDYLETGRKKNLLRWDIMVPPGATGTKAFAVEYKFSVVFDKQMTLTEEK